MDKRILELLIQLGFCEHPEKPLLYQKQVDENTTAYVDFRKGHNGSAEGRRFAKRGDDFIDDPDEIEVLRQFETERDRLFGQKEDIVLAPAKHKKKELVVGTCEALAAQYGIPLELANMFFMQFDSQMYIKNPGLLYLANKKGYSRIEIADKFDEKTGEWSAECKIYPRLTKEILEGIGKLAPELQKQGLDFATAPTNGLGRASKDNVMTPSMQPFLREMAQTRDCQRRCKIPQIWRSRFPHPHIKLPLDFEIFLQNLAQLSRNCQPMFLTFFKPVALPFDIYRGTMVQYPVKNSSSNNMVMEYLAPFTIRLI